MKTNGDIFVLENEFLLVRVSNVGASVLSATHKKYGDFLLHVGDDEFSDAYVGKTIAPWVNRVKNGVYSVRGVDYVLPVNDFDTNSALHGFVAWEKFDVLSLSGNSIVFEKAIFPSPAYPFKVFVRVEYKLVDDRVVVEVRAKNLSGGLAPVGLCSHPYIVHPDSDFIDDCYFSFSGGHIDLQGDFSDSSHVLLRNKSIDSCFEVSKGWKLKFGHTCNLKYTSKVVVASDSPFMHLYSGESVGRRGVAVEPCTSGIDMFGDSKGGLLLEADQELVLSYRVWVEN